MSMNVIQEQLLFVFDYQKKKKKKAVMIHMNIEKKHLSCVLNTKRGDMYCLSMSHEVSTCSHQARVQHSQQLARTKFKNRINILTQTTSVFRFHFLIPLPGFLVDLLISCRFVPSIFLVRFSGVIRWITAPFSVSVGSCLQITHWSPDCVGETPSLPLTSPNIP